MKTRRKKKKGYLFLSPCLYVCSWACIMVWSLNLRLLYSLIHGKLPNTQTQFSSWSLSPLWILISFICLFSPLCPLLPTLVYHKQTLSRGLMPFWLEGSIECFKTEQIASTLTCTATTKWGETSITLKLKLRSKLLCDTEKHAFGFFLFDPVLTVFSRWLTMIFFAVSTELPWARFMSRLYGIVA